MKFILISRTNEGIITKKEFDHCFLPDILEQFDMFLKGSGFSVDGDLSYVDENQEVLD